MLKFVLTGATSVEERFGCTSPFKECLFRFIQVVMSEALAGRTSTCHASSCEIVQDPCRFLVESGGIPACCDVRSRQVVLKVGTFQGLGGVYNGCGAA